MYLEVPPRPVGMQGLELFKAVTVDEVGLLERVLEVLDDAQVPSASSEGRR